jgi:hypothetical protein
MNTGPRAGLHLLEGAHQLLVLSASCAASTLSKRSSSSPLGPLRRSSEGGCLPASSASTLAATLRCTRHLQRSNSKAPGAAAISSMKQAACALRTAVKLAAPEMWEHPARCLLFQMLSSHSPAGSQPEKPSLAVAQPCSAPSFFCLNCRWQPSCCKVCALTAGEQIARRLHCCIVVADSGRAVIRQQ